jgi:hypothetical protein
MKITGFTFIRNAVKYDYPVVASINSILPICTDFVVSIGHSEDNTDSLIRSIGSQKIKIINSVWDDTLRSGGKVLAQETDKARHNIDDDVDWCFYIQADEVIHEQYLNTILQAMELYKDDLIIDGLLFNFLHFYGSYDYIGTSPSLYKKEIRIIRNDKNIYSYRDAQGFRKGNNEKLNVKEINAYVYHYGYVKEPHAMQRKHEEFGRLWNSDEWIAKNIHHADEYDYRRHLQPLILFDGTHPAVMQEKIRQKNWQFDCGKSNPRYTLRQKLKMLIEEKMGINLSYSNYKLI